MLKKKSFNIWLILLWAALTFISLSLRPLIPVDETRYASVAWEMWLSNDFLVPHLNGETYSHKPPLLFWLMQLSWRIFGVNDWSLRVISPLFALATLFLTRKLAKILWPDDEQAAVVSPFILLGSFAWAVFSTLTMFDIMLTFFVLVGILGLLMLAREDCQLKNGCFLALAIGGGALTKGPVILLHLLPLALSVPWWLKQADRPFSLRTWYGTIGMAILGGAAIALAWAIPAGMEGGEAYRKAIFLGQTSGRVVDSFAHKLPWWWYLQILPVFVLPWAFIKLFWSGLSRLNWQDSGTRFCMAWILPILLAFSLISGKRIHYLLPLMPAFALVIARAIAGLKLNNRLKSHIPYAIILGILGLLLILLPFLNGHLFRLKELYSLSPLWGLFVTSVATILGFAVADDIKQLIIYIATATILSMLLIVSGFFSIRGEYYDTAPVGRKIAEVQAENHNVAMFTDKYHGQFQFSGRLTRPLLIVPSFESLLDYAAKHPEDYLLVTYKTLTDVPESVFEYRHPYKSLTLGLLSTRNLAIYPALGKSLVP